MCCRCRTALTFAARRDAGNSKVRVRCGKGTSKGSEGLGKRKPKDSSSRFDQKHVYVLQCLCAKQNIFLGKLVDEGSNP